MFTPLFLPTRPKRGKALLRQVQYLCVGALCSSALIDTFDSPSKKKRPESSGFSLLHSNLRQQPQVFESGFSGFSAPQQAATSMFSFGQPLQQPPNSTGGFRFGNTVTPDQPFSFAAPKPPPTESGQGAADLHRCTYCYILLTV